VAYSHGPRRVLLHRLHRVPEVVHQDHWSTRRAQDLVDPFLAEPMVFAVFKNCPEQGQKGILEGWRSKGVLPVFKAPKDSVQIRHDSGKSIKVFDKHRTLVSHGLAAYFQNNLLLIL
jgi:hypothetical protein